MKGFFYGKTGVVTSHSLLFSADYWALSLDDYAQKWTEEQLKNYENLKAQGARIAYWRSDENGKACNHTIGKQEINISKFPGLIEEVRGKPTICTASVLHATLKPPRWKGSRLWIVALIGEVIGDEDKFASQRRIIIGEAMEGEENAQ